MGASPYLKMFLLFFEGFLSFKFCRVFIFAVGQSSTWYKVALYPKKDHGKPGFAGQSMSCVVRRVLHMAKDFDVCFIVFAVGLWHMANDWNPVVEAQVLLEEEDDTFKQENKCSTVHCYNFVWYENVMRGQSKKVNDCYLP